MTSIAWSLINRLASLLEPDESEVVLGDVMEASQSAWQTLPDLTGLVLRRHVAVWQNWRPWLAAFGIALPGSFLLMGFSISVSRAWQHFMQQAAGFDIGPGFALLICNVMLLVGWAWTGGFVIGTLSRRTVWVSALLSFAPCLFCLERFRVESLSRLCLMLFLPPAIWGVSRGLRLAQVKATAALVLAITLTALTIPAWNKAGAWIPNWALSWPAWYLVVASRKKQCQPN